MSSVRDLRIAFYSLIRTPGLALAVVLTLALGIGANAAIFTLVHGVLLKPLVNRGEDRLIYIRQSAPGIGDENSTFSVPEIQDLRSSVKTVSAFGDFSTMDFIMIGLDGLADLVFQSVKTGQPMRDNNILSRHIKPAARKLGLDWVNWRSLRNSHATWLKMAGADVKDAQAQMRHSRASTTLDIYQQFVPESQQKAVDRLTALTAAVQ